MVDKQEFRKQDLKAKNDKRTVRLSQLCREASNLSYALATYKTQNCDFQRIKEKLSKRINACASFSLYGKSIENQVNIISTMTCGDKLCPICNYLKQKAIRRKYMAFFNKEGNDKLAVEVEGKKEKFLFCGENDIEQHCGETIPYEMMTFTLTVPHSNGRYKGQRFYFRKIINDFNLLRKRWTKYILGGEYGVEVTKNELNEYHIHIHGILLVDSRFIHSRNYVHRNILLEWNKITAHNSHNKNKLNEKVFFKSNSMLKPKDLEKMNPQGAIMIEVRTIAGKGEHLINGIVEAISYHFKPNLFDIKDLFGNSTGFYDLFSLLEITRETRGLRMISRFGCLYGVSSLNVTNNDLLAEFEEVIKECETSDIDFDEFILTNPKNVNSNRKVMNVNLVVNYMPAEVGKKEVIDRFVKDYKDSFKKI